MCLHFLPYLLNICKKYEFLISQDSVATCLRPGGYCRTVFIVNFIRFSDVQKLWKSVKIWQSYGESKGGNFFETQCINAAANGILGTVMIRTMSFGLRWSDCYIWCGQEDFPGPYIKIYWRCKVQNASYIELYIYSRPIDNCAWLYVQINKPTRGFTCYWELLNSMIIVRWLYMIVWR